MSLSFRLSRATQSIALSGGAQILDQTRTSRPSHSLSPVFTRSLGQSPSLTLTQSLRYRTWNHHTSSWDHVPRPQKTHHCNKTNANHTPIATGQAREMLKATDKAQANARLLCYGLVSLSVIGLIEQILGLFDDYSGSDSTEKQDIPLPGFLGKTAEMISLAVKTPEEEQRTRRSCRRRVITYKPPNSKSKRSVTEVTTLLGNNQSWVTGLETTVYTYPGVL